MPQKLTLLAPAFPHAIQSGDDLTRLIGDALVGEAAPRPGDVIAVAQKIISKAEGRLVRLSDVTPSEPARALAAEVSKDPRFVELVLSESVRVVHQRPGLLIVQHRLGHVMANAGIDQSNVAPPGEEKFALLLPRDPDASAVALRAALQARFAVRLAVLVTDSFGRAWRQGTTGVALGAAGLESLRDLRGQPDLFGRVMEVTMIGIADEIASAASLLMGQAAEGQPVVGVRGFDVPGAEIPAAQLVRPEAEDLFR